jgi:hypothetical protein
MAASAQATIVVSRTEKTDIGHREIFVSLDGERLGILRHGETIRHAVTPGPHTIRAHNTLFVKRLDFDAQPGEQVHFTAINRAGWGTYSVLGWIGAGPLYLTFERTPA